MSGKAEDGRSRRGIVGAFRRVFGERADRGSAPTEEPPAPPEDEEEAPLVLGAELSASGHDKAGAGEGSSRRAMDELRLNPENNAQGPHREETGAPSSETRAEEEALLEAVLGAAATGSGEQGPVSEGSAGSPIADREGDTKSAEPASTTDASGSLWSSAYDKSGSGVDAETAEGDELSSVSGEPAMLVEGSDDVKATRLAPDEGTQDEASEPVSPFVEATATAELVEGLDDEGVPGAAATVGEEEKEHGAAGARAGMQVEDVEAPARPSVDEGALDQPNSASMREEPYESAEAGEGREERWLTQGIGREPSSRFEDQVAETPFFPDLPGEGGAGGETSTEDGEGVFSSFATSRPEENAGAEAAEKPERPQTAARQIETEAFSGNAERLALAGRPALGAGDTLSQYEIEELVRRVLREELEGEMGERLSRNLRRLIRSEIEAALRER